MIESIKIKEVASYDEVGIQIDDLKKINFIYGGNGCGKTTISNALNSINVNELEYCKIVWKNNLPIKTLVYNKEFRKANFENGKIAGVFTLGEATKKEIETIEKKQIELKQIKEDGTLKRETLKKQEDALNALDSDFVSYVWTDIYKRYEHDFKEVFKGVTNNKINFKNRLIREVENNKVDLLPFAILKEKSNTIFGKEPTHIPLINQIKFERIIEIEKEHIWSKIVVGKADVDIATLIQKLNLNDWVNQGRKYISESKVCPFCQNETMTLDFKKQLESYFDKTYLQDIKSIEQLKSEYNIAVENLINELNIIETNQKSFLGTKLNIDKFSALLKTLLSQNTSNTEFLNNKLKEPSRSILLVSIESQLLEIEKLIIDANTEIEKHNEIVLNFSTEKINLVNSIWRFLIETFKKDIDTYLKASSSFQKGINSINEIIENKILAHKKLKTEIEFLSKNVTSIQPAVNEINRLLKSYGFLNFEIVKSLEEDGFYQIKREDGSIAESTLSEGEITFITFLYYLQLTKGGATEESVNDERILVIDDPISSLDSNVLFLVSTLIKEIIKKIKSNESNIKQLILLTHNIYFHKEVSFVDGKSRNCDKTNFWILRKNLKTTTIQAYNNRNPIQSSYELLWREIKEWDKNSGITIQNTMRRIIENYYSILGNRRDDFLITKFDSKEEQEICRSLLSWVNEGSHTIPDDLYVEVPDVTIHKYLKVFKDIFTHTKNAGHYNMMMEIGSEITEDIAV